jgi:hypothetical protein
LHSLLKPTDHHLRSLCTSPHETQRRIRELLSLISSLGSIRGSGSPGSPSWTRPARHDSATATSITWHHSRSWLPSTPTSILRSSSPSSCYTPPSISLPASDTSLSWSSACEWRVSDGTLSSSASSSSSSLPLASQLVSPTRGTS